MTDNSLQAETTATEPSELNEDANKEVMQDNTATETGEFNAQSAEGVEESNKRELSEDEMREHGIQRRIDRIKAATEAEKRRINDQLEQANRKIAELQKFAPKQENLEPKQEDFDTLEDYTNAVVEYRTQNQVQKQLEEQARIAEQQKKQAELEQKRENLYKNMDEFSKNTPDFDEKRQTFEELSQLYANRYAGSETVQAVSRTILDSENPALLIYKLGADPDLADKIVQMDSYSAIKELAKLELSYSEPKQKPTPPKPIEDVRSVGSSSTDYSKMNAKDLKKRFVRR